MSGTEIRRELLAQVEQCVCQDRQNTYGDAEDNFANIAALMNVFFQFRRFPTMFPEDAAVLGIIIKLSRLIQSPQHLDNWIDLAGYAICGGGIVVRKIENDRIQKDG